MVRSDKLSKLVAVFDEFYGALSAIDDLSAKRLAESWTGVRRQLAEPGCPPRSVLAAGMEQGLRELPVLLESMSPEIQKGAACALAAATRAHYPDFLLRDAERLAAVKERGSIRGESEFHLVCHQIDVLEGDPSREKELRPLYALAAEYEGRRV